ncbi:SRPBCC family protein [Nonomuraea muscovyensis]|uniref:SRPBCC family protein n=1 Tax=Nonomuraea muscovyensis TaxID=1124761 RepID=UPI0033FF3B96|nr:cyclase [Nonomuraea muscovyensis]
MSTIEHSVDVNVPIRVAYNQWTQFESFPEFMEGVESVKQLTDTRTHWITEIAGVKREFDAEITEQHPDERIAWHSIDKPRQAGVVTFHRLNDDTTKVTLQMEYDPEGFVETAGDWLQLVRLRVRGDMERFKAFIESRGGETGAWRGDVPGPHQHGSGYDAGGAVPPGTGGNVPPGTVGGPDLTPGGTPGSGSTLPPPGPIPTRDEPPQGPRPVL